MTVLSCGPEGKGAEFKVKNQETDTIIATSCPGKPTSSATTLTGPPVSSFSVVAPHDSTYAPAVPSPPAPPAEHPVLPPPPAEHLSAPSVPTSSSKPYPTSVVTVVTSSKEPVGTGTGVVHPSVNAT